MSKVAYIHRDQPGGKLVVSKRTQLPPNLVCECPKDQDGRYVVDLDVIDLIDKDGKKFATINYTKLQQKQDEKEQKRIKGAWKELRRLRDTYLEDSDWTMLDDIPLTLEKKQEWKAYRQALRDLPNNTNDPKNATWPNKPE